MDKEDVVNIKDDIKIPYLIDKAHLPHAESNFKNIFDSMVVSPINTRVLGKIRALLEESLAIDTEEAQKTITNKPKDIFLENKEDDDKAKKDSSGDTGKRGKQRNKEQESEEGEWEAPDPISG